FEHVLHTRHPCTALSFGLRDRRQFLAALADGDVRLLAIGQSGSGPASELATLSGHSAAVTGISPHSGGRYVLTTDPDVTLLWDVDARSRLRRLSVREDVQLLLASFVPTRNLILTAFRDDSLFLWDSETLQCRGQLPTPPPPLQLSGLSTGAEAELGPRYRSLDFTPDGRQLVACGQTRQVHVWDLDSLQMARVLELPANLRQHQRRSLALTSSWRFGRVVCVSLGAGGGRIHPGGGISFVSVTGRFPPMPQLLPRRPLMPQPGRRLEPTLLQLPENTAAFNALYNKGIHPAFLTLQDRFPLRSNKLGRVLQRSLSCVAFWSPLFGEADYLPLLAFPFVKLFQNSQLHSMEVLMTVLTNWCGHWFEYFPNPPLNILAIIENLIAYHDKELYAHLCARGVTSEILAWPLLQTLLTEVLTREEWLSVWDCLLCHPPGYLLYFVAGFTLLSRGPLLRATEVREFELYYRQPGCLGARDLVKQARQLRTRTPAEICPCRLLPAFAPLGGPQYPLFNRYPVFIVDYQVRERDRLREEERRYLEERRALETAQRRSETQRAEEAAWCRQQELLLAAEERRRAMLAQEETTLREQRRQLAAEQRRARVDELAALTAQRQRLRALQSRHRQVEAQRLGDQLGRRQRQTTAADLEDDIIDDEADGLDDDYDDNGSPGLMPQSGGASAGFGLVSELEGVCQDNGRLEADVGRLLDRLQAARDRLKTSGSAAVRKQKSGLNAGTAASLQAAVAAAAANAEGHDDDDATTTTSQSSY
uniref:TBC1 domain family member 31 n=1 Tax=Macrostomum lignano TaxID=282301 RepID=A0A1I8GKL4_9PLAT